MYLARFDMEDGEWLQGSVLVSVGTHEVIHKRHGLFPGLESALRGVADIPDATIGRRLTFEPEVGLRFLLWIGAPSRYERQVRTALARLSSLERANGYVVSASQLREEHDRALADIGNWVVCSTDEVIRVGDVPLAHPQRFLPVLDRLLDAPSVLGHRIDCQAVVRRIDVNSEWVRSARKSALRLEEIRGLRPALLDRQRLLAQSLERATALVEECIAVDSDNATSLIVSTLRSHFFTESAELGLGSPTLRFRTLAEDDALRLGLHSHDITPLPLSVTLGTAISTQEQTEILQWRPGSQVLLDAIADRTPRDVTSASSLDDIEAARSGEADEVPAAYMGDAAFAFVSYKREDLPRIAPILHSVVNDGLPIWYDRGIPGGSEWDAVIEERLSRCRCVLLFTSRAAVGSKFVRREVKFADALDVPVLNVMLEDVTLTHGLRMLLTQYQMLDSRAPDFALRLTTAIKHVLSSETPHA